MSVKSLNHSLFFVVVVVFICLFAGSSPARVVDSFTSYTLDSNLLDNPGVPWEELSNSNNDSPEIKDFSGGYPEYRGKYLKITDDNTVKDGDSNSWEYVSISLPVPLTSDGEYVEIAIYRSNEPIQDPCDPNNWIAAGGTTGFYFEDANDANTINFIRRGSMGLRGGLYAWYLADVLGTIHYETPKPMPNNWYIIRATMRDTDSDGDIDAFDFETFDTDMNPLLSRPGRDFIRSDSETELPDGIAIERVSISNTGSNSMAVALYDHLKIGPDPGIFSCEDVWDQSYGLYADINYDCLINLEDFALVAADWLLCNTPGDSNCIENW